MQHLKNKFRVYYCLRKFWTRWHVGRTTTMAFSNLFCRCFLIYGNKQPLVATISPCTICSSMCNSVYIIYLFLHYIIPESVWAKGSSNSGGLSSHFLITSSHLHTFSSSHLPISSSSNLLIFTSSHLHIFSLLPSCSLALLPSLSLSCPLTFLPSCPLAFLPSGPLALLLSCLLALLPSSLSFFSISLLRRGAVPTRRHEMQPFRTKLGSVGKKWLKIAIWSPAQPFCMKWNSIGKKSLKIVILKRPAQPFWAKRGSIGKNCGKIAI